MRKQLTPLGAFTRPRREKLGISLGEMADRLGVSSARLSTVELNRGPVPRDWIERITTILELDDHEVSELQSIQAENLIDKLGPEGGSYRQLLSDLTRNRDSIPEEGIQEMRQIILAYAKERARGQESKNGAFSKRSAAG